MRSIRQPPVAMRLICATENVESKQQFLRWNSATVAELTQKWN
jgi:hypothetical protein